MGWWVFRLAAYLALVFLNIYYGDMTEDSFIKIVHIWLAVFMAFMAFHAWLMVMITSIDAYERSQKK